MLRSHLLIPVSFTVQTWQCAPAVLLSEWQPMGTSILDPYDRHAGAEGGCGQEQPGCAGEGQGAAEGPQGGQGMHLTLLTHPSAHWFV